MTDVEYFSFDIGEDKPAGLLRRIRNGGSSIQVVSWDGEWVNHPDGLRYFEEFGGDSLDLVPLTEAEAHERAAELGVSLDGDDEIVTQEELASLSDERLVRLIMERSNLDEEQARETLALIRGGPPEGVIY
jgi:hypothetical protein